MASLVESADAGDHGLSDEVYREMAYGPSPGRLPARGERVSVSALPSSTAFAGSGGG